MRRPVPHGSRGFTLLELLAVSSLIVILLALIFPLARQMREASERAQCAAQMRSVGAALLSIAAERNGRLPPLGELAPSEQRPTWGMVTAEAMGVSLAIRGQKTAFWCPADKSAEIDNGPWMHANHVGHSSYAVNLHLMDWRQGNSTLGGVARGGAFLSSIPSPGRTILLMENHRPNNVISWSDQGGKTFQAGWTFEYTLRGQDEASDPGKRGYHKGVNNWFFVDGHIESIAFRETLSPQILWTMEPR